MGFFNSLGDSYSLIVLAFVLVSVMVYAGGGGYADKPLIGWLGLLYYVPMALVFALGSSLGGGAIAFMPVIVIAFFAYSVFLSKWLGPLEGLALVGWIALVLGA